MCRYGYSEFGIGRNLAIDTITMKWFNRTAQGFSPGNCRDKPRPERAGRTRFDCDIMVCCHRTLGF